MALAKKRNVVSPEPHQHFLMDEIYRLTEENNNLRSAIHTMLEMYAESQCNPKNTLQKRGL